LISGEGVRRTHDGTPASRRYPEQFLNIVTGSPLAGFACAVPWRKVIPAKAAKDHSCVKKIMSFWEDYTPVVLNSTLKSALNVFI